MAKARAKKKDETQDLPLDDGGVMVPTRGIEALGIGMLILALGLCFALFSFDPGDAGGRGNLVGPLGSGAARVILGGIGVAGYVVGLLGVGLAGATLFGRVRWPSPLATVSAASLMIGVCVLAQLVVGEPAVLGHPAGGALGLALSGLLRGVAGPAGAGLCGVGLVLLGVIGISNLSFSLALQEGFRALRFVGAALTGRLQVWREASAVARQREAELVDAARSRRAQARMEQDERARLLQESLDEKRRVAVLKATAKAEEKALKKIAALEAKQRVEQALSPSGEAEAAPDDMAEDAAVVASEATAASEAETDGFARPGPEVVAAAEAEADEEMQDALLSPAAVAPEAPQVILRAAPATPAAPEPVTVAFDVQPSADVIEDIDRRTRRPGPAAEPPVIVAAPSVIEELEEDDDEVDSASELPSARPAQVDDEASTGELVIHERKACEAHFEDEDAVAHAPPEVEEAKPVYELPPHQPPGLRGRGPRAGGLLDLEGQGHPAGGEAQDLRGGRQGDRHPARSGGDHVRVSARAGGEGLQDPEPLRRHRHEHGGGAGAHRGPHPGPRGGGHRAAQRQARERLPEGGHRPRPLQEVVVAVDPGPGQGRRGRGAGAEPPEDAAPVDRGHHRLR
jgi:hypothetical protein